MELRLRTCDCGNVSRRTLRLGQHRERDVSQGAVSYDEQALALKLRSYRAKDHVAELSSGMRILRFSQRDARLFLCCRLAASR